MPAKAHVSPEIIKSTLTKTVRIYNPRTGGLGSGVIIKPGNLILTVSHVIAENSSIAVDEAPTLYVSFDEGSIVEAVTVYADTVNDLAILKISGQSSFPYVEIGNEPNRFDRGKEVFAVGCPFAEINHVMVGNISNFRILGEKKFICLNVNSLPGLSGGGVFDNQGRLIGIVQNSQITSKVIKNKNNTIIFSTHLGIAMSIETIIKVLGSRFGF